MSSSLIRVQYHHSPVGELILGDHEGKLCLLDYRHRQARARVDARLRRCLHAEYQEQDTPLLQRVRQQLREYFSQQRQNFDLPLQLAGTEFQQQVWQALLAIPYSETRSYRQLSQDMGCESAIRAVASANGANAIGIVVPCHRIIGSDGSLVGYAGGLKAKQHLLTLEGKYRQLSLW